MKMKINIMKCHVLKLCQCLFCLLEGLGSSAENDDKKSYLQQRKWQFGKGENLFSKFRNILQSPGTVAPSRDRFIPCRTKVTFSMVTTWNKSISTWCKCHVWTPALDHCVIDKGICKNRCMFCCVACYSSVVALDVKQIDGDSNSNQRTPYDKRNVWCILKTLERRESKWNIPKWKWEKCDLCV